MQAKTDESSSHQMLKSLLHSPPIGSFGFYVVSGRFQLSKTVSSMLGLFTLRCQLHDWLHGPPREDTDGNLSSYFARWMGTHGWIFDFQGKLCCFFFWVIILNMIRFSWPFRFLHHSPGTKHLCCLNLLQ